MTTLSFLVSFSPFILLNFVTPTLARKLSWTCRNISYRSKIQPDKYMYVSCRGVIMSCSFLYGLSLISYAVVLNMLSLVLQVEVVRVVYSPLDYGIAHQLYHYQTTDPFLLPKVGHFFSYCHACLSNLLNGVFNLGIHSLMLSLWVCLLLCCLDVMFAESVTVWPTKFLCSDSFVSVCLLGSCLCFVWMFDFMGQSSLWKIFFCIEFWKSFLHGVEEFK